MDEAAVVAAITGAFAGSETTVVAGDTFFFTGSDHMFPFATLVTKDEYENVSELNRPGIYRLNIGVGKETFRAHFGDETVFPDNERGRRGHPHRLRLRRARPTPPPPRLRATAVGLHPQPRRRHLSSARSCPLLTEAHAIGVTRDARRATTAAKRAAQE